MGIKQLAKYYWNPIVFLVSTVAMFGTVIENNLDLSHTLTGSLYYIAAIIGILIVPFLILWLLFLVASWAIGLLQFITGLWSYRKTKNNLVLHHVWSALLSFAIYAVTFILFSFGYYPDA